mgnify:CR=1 FL=1
MGESMKLSETAIRAKVAELFDGCNQARLDMWLFSGIRAGVLDADIVERILNEEIHLRSREVQAFWGAPCNCHGTLN